MKIFVQNIMLMDNHTVFNGLIIQSHKSTYRYLDILFYYQNNFLQKNIFKSWKSNNDGIGNVRELAYRINVRGTEIVSDEGKRVILPDSSRIKEFASYVGIDEW